MSANNGQTAPGWFKAFVSEYRDDRKLFTQAIHSLTEHLNRNSAEIHDMRLGLERMNRELERTNRELERTNREIERTNKELIHTRNQSAKLFRRLIVEVKALRPRR